MSFVPDSTVLIPFTIATMILAITPGPDMTLFVGRALTQGRAAGFAAMAGTFCGITVHAFLVAAGISALIVASPKAFLVLKLFGAGYLVFLAWQAIVKGSAFSPGGGPVRRQSLLRNWLAGVGVNLSNPKIILFYMTFLPQFVSASDPQAPAKLFFLGVLFIAVSIPITAPMVLAADTFSMLLKRNPTVTRAIDWLFAGVFSAFAVRILMTSNR